MLLKVCKIASKTIMLEKDNSYLREQHPKVATLLAFLHSFSLLLRHPDRVNRFCYLYFPPHISTEMGLILITSSCLIPHLYPLNVSGKQQNWRVQHCRKWCTYIERNYLISDMVWLGSIV